MIFFTADTHFCHENIIRHCKRPFGSVDEMNRVLIDNWNSRVHSGDDVYILGDFMYKGNGRDANTILSQLRGRKYLVRGNHERYVDDPEFDKSAFEWIKDYYVLTYEKRKMVLFHYPIISWDGSFHGSIHLYGHVHNNGLQYPDFGEKLEMLGKAAVNVGVDVTDFSPVSVAQIFEMVG